VINTPYNDYIPANVLLSQYKYAEAHMVTVARDVFDSFVAVDTAVDI